MFKAGTAFERPNSPPYINEALDGSLFNIHQIKPAKARRDLYMPFFSRKSIQQLEVLIHRQLTKFLDKLEAQAASAGNNVDMTLGYKCLTADVIMEYSFQKNLGFLDAPDFQHFLILALDDFFKTAPVQWYLPNLSHFMFLITSNLPQKVVEKYIPALAGTKWVVEVSIVHETRLAWAKILQQCNARIKELLSEKDSQTEKSELRSVFANAIAVDPEKGVERISEQQLTGDAFLFFGAGTLVFYGCFVVGSYNPTGTDTTANALAFGTWYILQNPDTLRKLQTELKTAIPERKSERLMNWLELEKLPYLVRRRRHFV